MTAQVKVSQLKTLRARVQHWYAMTEAQKTLRVEIKEEEGKTITVPIVAAKADELMKAATVAGMAAEAGTNEGSLMLEAELRAIKEAGERRDIRDTEAREAAKKAAAAAAAKAAANANRALTGPPPALAILDGQRPPRQGKGGAKGGKAPLPKGIRAKCDNGKLVCYSYNRREPRCVQEPCTFEHVCWWCHGTHPGGEKPGNQCNLGGG